MNRGSKMTIIIDWSKITKKDQKIIDRIVKRAMVASRKHNLGLDVVSVEMDIKAVHLKTRLELERWVSADDFNFAHDVCGIIRHLDRETGKLKDYFVPRFSNPKLPKWMKKYAGGSQ